MRLENKVAVVTGSTSGIGLAVAKLFASEGAKVIIAARKKDIGEKIAAEIKADGGEGIFVHLEVTDQQDWANVVKTAKEVYGGLHILVNNAGTNEMAALPNVDLEVWNKVMAINVTGPMLGMQACAPLMKASGGGAIVNVGSLAGLQGTFGTAYSTSKWALRGLSASAAYNFADWGIRCNTVHPGFIRNTNLTNAIEAAQSASMPAENPLAAMALAGRGGETMELAQAVLFLASDESSYINGIDLPVDGGLYDTGVYAVARNKMALLLGKQAD